MLRRALAAAPMALAKGWGRRIRGAAGPSQEGGSLTSSVSLPAIEPLTLEMVEHSVACLFAEGDCDECPVEDLLHALPHAPDLEEVVPFLEDMEDRNLLMYREGVIHLIRF